jgi:hypothetical protein
MIDAMATGFSENPYPCLFRVPSVAMMCILVYAGI